MTFTHFALPWCFCLLKPLRHLIALGFGFGAAFEIGAGGLVGPD